MTAKASEAMVAVENIHNVFHHSKPFTECDSGWCFAARESVRALEAEVARLTIPKNYMDEGTVQLLIDEVIKREVARAERAEREEQIAMSLVRDLRISLNAAEARLAEAAKTFGPCDWRTEEEYGEYGSENRSFRYCNNHEDGDTNPLCLILNPISNDPAGRKEA